MELTVPIRFSGTHIKGFALYPAIPLPRSTLTSCNCCWDRPRRNRGAKGQMKANSGTETHSHKRHTIACGIWACIKPQVSLEQKSSLLLEYTKQIICSRTSGKNTSLLAEVVLAKVRVRWGFPLIVHVWKHARDDPADLDPVLRTCSGLCPSSVEEAEPDPVRKSGRDLWHFFTCYHITLLLVMGRIQDPEQSHRIQ